MSNETWYYVVYRVTQHMTTTPPGAANETNVHDWQWTRTEKVSFEEGMRGLIAIFTDAPEIEAFILPVADWVEGMNDARFGTPLEYTHYVAIARLIAEAQRSKSDEKCT